MSARDVVERVARLSRIELAEAEVEQVATELDAILDYVGRLTAPLGGASRASGGNRFRRPGLRVELSAAERLANAAESADGSFSVPKVI